MNPPSFEVPLLRLTPHTFGEAGILFGQPDPDKGFPKPCRLVLGITFFLLWEKASPFSPATSQESDQEKAHRDHAGLELFTQKNLS